VKTMILQGWFYPAVDGTQRNMNVQKNRASGEFLFNRSVVRDDLEANPLAYLFATDNILQFHSSIKEYAPTPLVSLPALAARYGIGQILVKDESERFGLKAFKALGASYAIYRFIKQRVERDTGVLLTVERFWEGVRAGDFGTFTFCTASDGNHGRGVAWTAGKLAQRAVVFMPWNTVRARVRAIENEGARVVVVDGTYDDAVTTAAKEAEQNGWQIISDTSYPGYTEVPLWIMAGYMTMFHEIENTISETGLKRPDFVLVQAGVGALAATAAFHYGLRRVGHEPGAVRLIAVEPTDADCLLESARGGDEIVASRGSQNSIMAGLNCGMPSMIAWEIISRRFDLFVSIPDDYSERAMRQYYYPEAGDRQIISGESGAASLGGLIALMTDETLGRARERLRLGTDSSVLLINTEGDTDPVNFERVVSRGNDD
ncbi:MAG: diaminopropionate ammonia-lyase, partial [candidate division Zixibacteria bacterium]|nr:diaminopropionate ammonia-lyase [candidate division Zixibacteria bacterium]